MALTRLSVLIIVLAQTFGQDNRQPVDVINLRELFGAEITVDAVVISGKSSLMAIDYSHRRLLQYDLISGKIKSAGGQGREAELIDPVSIAINGYDLLVADRATQRILVYDHFLNFRRLYDLSVTGPDIYPDMITSDHWGRVLIYDQTASQIYQLDTHDGQLSRWLDLGPFPALNDITAFRASRDGKIYLTGSRAVGVFTRLGRKIMIVPQTGTRFLSPLAIDGEMLLVTKAGSWFTFPEMEAIPAPVEKIGNPVNGVGQSTDYLYFLIGDQPLLWLIKN